jgi:hypothetical protein
MTVAIFIGLYFLASIGAALFIGRFIRAGKRAIAADPKESMDASLIQLDARLRSSSTEVSPEVPSCTVQSTPVEDPARLVCQPSTEVDA